PALHGSEPGQVRKEAATAILCKCRGQGSPPSFWRARRSIRARRERMMAERSAGSVEGNPKAGTGQALARKWRPRRFEELVGQEHVVRALTNALRQNRLHHAWLLTGTRGVGKTTLARIMAKALNCETGITATPCGVCSACTEIDAGRFVDLL